MSNRYLISIKHKNGFSEEIVMNKNIDDIKKMINNAFVTRTLNITDENGKMYTIPSEFLRDSIITIQEF